MIRFGIIGTNFVSDMFMAGLNRTDMAEVTCVCSGHVENAYRFAEKYNIPHVYGDMDEMMAAHECDAIYVATPNAMHCAHALKVIEAGYPVFVEKPFTTNITETEKLLEAAQKHNVTIHDGIVPLYNPEIETIREALGQIGPIHAATLSFAKYSSRYDAYLEGKNPTTFRRELSNGGLMDLGVYPISVALGLFGEPQDIKASCQLLDTGVDVAGSAIMVYPQFNVNVLWSKASNTNIISEICGEKGMIRIYGISLLNKVDLVNKEGTVELVRGEAEGFKDQIEDFCRCINEGKVYSSMVPADMSRLLSRTLTDIRKQVGVIYPADEVEHE